MNECQLFKNICYCKAFVDILICIIKKVIFFVQNSIAGNINYAINWNFYITTKVTLCN